MDHPDLKIELWELLRHLSLTKFEKARAESLKEILKMARDNEPGPTKLNQIKAVKLGDGKADSVRAAWAENFGLKITHNLRLFDQKIGKYSINPIEVVMEKDRESVLNELKALGDKPNKAFTSKLSATNIISQYENLNNSIVNSSSEFFKSTLEESIDANQIKHQPKISSPIVPPKNFSTQKTEPQASNDSQLIMNFMNTKFEEILNRMQNLGEKANRGEDLALENKSNIEVNAEKISSNEKDIRNLEKEQRKIQETISKFNILKTSSEVGELTQYKLAKLWSEFTRERKDYMNAVQQRLQQGHLRFCFQKPELYILNHLSYKNDGDPLKLNIPVIEAKLRESNLRPIKIVGGRSYESYNGKFYCDAFVKTAAVNRKELTKLILRNRARNKGHFSISVGVPEKYKIDEWVMTVMNSKFDEYGEKIISKFNLSLYGQYYIVLNDPSEDKKNRFIADNPDKRLREEDYCTRLNIVAPHMFTQIHEENFTLQGLTE